MRTKKNQNRFKMSKKYKKDLKKNKLIIAHNGGFFSCCTIMLDKILNWINNNKKVPFFIDTKGLFTWYKSKKNHNKDITSIYFRKNRNVKITNYDIKFNGQFSDYKLINFKKINPIIKKYFSPSKEILNIIQFLEIKYNLEYQNICALFHRGNDKQRETNLCSYNDYYEKALTLTNNNQNVRFLIQSDETEFLEFMKNKLPNSFYMKDEIRHIRKNDTTVDHINENENFKYSKYFLAIVIIMSKCKHIIFGSGSISNWIVFFRNNANNVQQYLSPKEYIYGEKNKNYDPNQTNFWI